MKCSYCGEELKDGSLYCSRCGKEAQIRPDMNAFEDDYLKAIMEEENQKQETASEAKQPKQEIRQPEGMKKQQEKKKKLLLLSGIAAACVLIAVLAAALHFSSQKEHDSSFEYQVAQARKAESSGNTAEAIAYYEKALVIDPDSTEVRLTLARILTNQNEYDSAIILYQEVIQIDPKNQEAYRNLIAIYEENGDTDAILALSKDASDPKILKLFQDYIVLPPEFDQKSGTYDDYMEIRLTSEDHCDIFYTTDGRDPVRYGEPYSRPIALDEMQEYEIKAVCVNDRKIYSDVASETYTIKIPVPEMPVVSPDGGEFSEETQVSITVPEGCTAYYTWDGTDPNINSEPYNGPITVPEGNNVLAVIFIDTKTEQISPIYRGNFIYYAQDAESE